MKTNNRILHLIVFGLVSFVMGLAIYHRPFLPNAIESFFFGLWMMVFFALLEKMKS